MRALIILGFAIVCCVQGAKADYQVFEENGKVGLKDDQGAVLLPPTFQALGWSDGNFSVIGQVTGYKLGDTWGLINLKKEYITKAAYESLLYSGGDRVVALKKISPTASRYGCLDLSGKVLVPFLYDGISINGLRAVVFIKNGARFEHGLVDLNNHQKIPLQFKNIYPVGGLRFAVENFEGKTALFSEQGVRLTEFVIDSISYLRPGAAIIFQNLKQGLMDSEGQIVVPPTYREIKLNDDGAVVGRDLDEWKILDGGNHELRKISADQLKPLSASLYKISISGKAGAVDENFNSKIPLVYDDLRDMHAHLMVAKLGGKSGLIRPDQSIVLPIEFDSLIWDGSFIRALEKYNGKTGWNLYDTFGIKKTATLFDFIGDYNSKFFPVRSKGYWGAVNRYGEEFIHCVFDSLLEYDDERMVVGFQHQFGIIDLKENWLALPQPFPVRLVNHEVYLELQPTQTFVKTFAGEIIYFTDNPFHFCGDHFLETLPDGTEKKVSLDGREISRTSVQVSEKVGGVHEGLQGIQRDGRFGFVDELGRLRIANRYEGIGEFSEGLAAIKILGRWGFVDASDNIVVNPSFEAATKFQYGRCIVSRGGKMGVIDKNGNVVLNLRYDSVATLSQNAFLIKLQGRQGLANHEGKVIIEPDYDTVTDFSNGYMGVTRAGKSGLISGEGLSTIPMTYDGLYFQPQKNLYLAHQRSGWTVIRP